MPSIVANLKAVEKDEMQWGLIKAQKHNLVIVEPKPNELQLDLDSDRAIKAYGAQYNILKRGGLTKGWRCKMRTSKSGKTRVHITITMPKRIDDLRRVAFQACLGSDLKREAFNLCRVINGNKYPIVFFEKEK